MNKIVIGLFIGLSIIFITGFIYLFICKVIHRSKKPYVVIDGTIHHPTYGLYPQKVDFKHGMTLYPGQSAVITISQGSWKEKK